MPVTSTTVPFAFVSRGPEKGLLLIPQIVDGHYVTARSKRKEDKEPIPVSTPWADIRAKKLGLRMVIASRPQNCGPRYISHSSIRWP